MSEHISSELMRDATDVPQCPDPGSAQTLVQRPDPDLDDDSEPYVGIMQLANMLMEHTANLRHEDPFGYEDDIRGTYAVATTIHGHWHRHLATFLEEQRFPAYMIEQQYDVAIEHDDTSVSLSNYADYWKKLGNDPMMIVHLMTAIRVYRCMYAMVYLALHYAKHRQHETAQMYYEMAVQRAREHPCQFELETYVETVELVKLMEFIHDGGWDRHTIVYTALASEHAQRREIVIYQTKVRLFTSLNHIAECGVCFDHALHLNLTCGHCVCTDCYLRLAGKTCPFCREAN